MKIITVPHPTLRTTAAPVTVVDRKLKAFISNLEDTLFKKTNPKGVGLAAPQVDVKWRIFVTQLTPDGGRESNEELAKLRAFINPEIIQHGNKKVLGPQKGKPTLEGCLSIPGLYGPVPRWEKITLKYYVIEDEKLVAKTESFDDFAARVVQHEVDHLNGVLFIDYTLQEDLPLYAENEEGELEEIEREFVKALVTQTQ